MRDLRKALELIKKWEGFRSKAYKDPVGIWTIGYGTIRYPDGRKVESHHSITKTQATEYLKEHITDDILPVMERLIKVDINDNQYNAIVSFIYNLGSGNFQRSTLLKKLNNKDYLGAAKEFDRWVKAGGKKLKGLVRRRAEERALFEEAVTEIISKDDPMNSDDGKWFLDALIELISNFIKKLLGKKVPVDIKEEILKKNKNINPRALDMALMWKQNDVRLKGGRYMAVVDMDMYDYEKRFHFIDLETFTSLSTWCAHGVKSDTDRDNKADRFSNVSGSNQSSLGAMWIAEEYVSVKRKTGSRSSFQISRRIDGLEKGVNDNVRKRAIVLHDGFYVTPERAKAKNVGDSLGCFVLYYPVLKDINKHLDGCFLYSYSEKRK